jgi:hypothetical protein
MTSWNQAYNGANWNKSDTSVVHERLAQLRNTVFQNGTAPGMHLKKNVDLVLDPTFRSKQFGGRAIWCGSPKVQDIH